MGRTKEAIWRLIEDKSEVPLSIGLSIPHTVVIEMLRAEDKSFWTEIYAGCVFYRKDRHQVLIISASTIEILPKEAWNERQ